MSFLSVLAAVFQCLSIFGDGHSKTRTWIQSTIEYGLAYLLDRERRFGKQGRFLNQSEKFYDRIHTAYCAIMGLLSLHPVERKKQTDEATLELILMFGEPHPDGPVFLPNGKQIPLACGRRDPLRRRTRSEALCLLVLIAATLHGHSSLKALSHFNAP